MKTFIGSLITLAVLIICVTLNCLYIESCAGELTEILEDMPETAEEADISPLREKWDGCKKIIGLTVSHRETDEIDDTISQIESYIESRNDSSYRASLTTLGCQIERLSQSEALSLDRIL